MSPLDPDARRACRAALAGFLPSIDALAQADLSTPPGKAVLGGGHCLDVTGPWLRDPIFSFVVDLGELASADWGDPGAVGRRIRSKVAELVERGRGLVETADWLGGFELEGPRRQAAAIIVELTRDCLRALAVLVDARTTADDATATRGELEVEDDFGRLSTQMKGLARLGANPGEPLAVGPAVDAALGPQLEPGPLDDLDDVLPAFRPVANQTRLAPIVARQLLPIITPPFRMDHDRVPGLFMHVVMLVASPMALLAYRSAYLAYAAVGRGLAVDPSATRRLVTSAQPLHAGRMMAMRQRLADGNRDESNDALVTLALIEQYGRLAEAKLRPFGTLVLALAEVAAGREPPDIAAPPLLGELDDRLRASDEPACHLLAEHIDRELRNARAHEGAVIDSSGGVILESRRAINWDEARWRMWVLDAALSGIDTAISVAMATNNWTHSASVPRDATLAFAGEIARIILPELARVPLLGMEVGADTLELRMGGAADEDRLADVAQDLAPHLGESIQHIRFVSIEPPQSFTHRLRG